MFQSRMNNNHLHWKWSMSIEHLIKVLAHRCRRLGQLKIYWRRLIKFAHVVFATKQSYLLTWVNCAATYFSRRMETRIGDAQSNRISLAAFNNKQVATQTGNRGNKNFPFACESFAVLWTTPQPSQTTENLLSIQSFLLCHCLLSGLSRSLYALQHMCFCVRTVQANRCSDTMPPFADIFTASMENIFFSQGVAFRAWTWTTDFVLTHKCEHFPPNLLQLRIVSEREFQNQPKKLTFFSSVLCQSSSIRVHFEHYRPSNYHWELTLIFVQNQKQEKQQNCEKNEIQKLKSFVILALICVQCLRFKIQNCSVNRFRCGENFGLFYFFSHFKISFTLRVHCLS